MGLLQYIKRLFAPITGACDACGGRVRVGDWPFCHGDPSAHTHVKRFGDDPIESYDDRNVDVQTRRITTRGERRALMRKNHLEYVPKLERRTYIDLGSC